MWIYLIIVKLPNAMFTYQIRPRVFRHQPEEELTFPAKCTLSFHFQPLQPFGEAAGGGRTAVQSTPASVLFNANNGEHTIESKEPLTLLDVTIEEPIRIVRMSGRKLTISQRFESLVEMEQVIMSIYFLLPALLNVSFADPPYVERVDGTVGCSSFRWELSDWRMKFQVTTQELQETRVLKAWKRIGILSEPHRRRLVAGLHYFHQACRLARQGSIVGEFVAEVILNLAKSLEVLFPPSGDGRSRDAVRQGLRKLGIADDDIECNFIPAIALRNEIDVGHVELELFKMEQLKTIHAFTERSEGAFHEMFERLFDQIESGDADIAPYDLRSPRSEALTVIERLKRCAAKFAD
jgi:hypothetical protein